MAHHCRHNPSHDPILRHIRAILDEPPRSLPLAAERDRLLDALEGIRPLKSA